MRTAEALAYELRECSPLSEIIFLGDILDLQLANWAQAIEGRFLAGPRKRAPGFRHFINFLLDRTGARSIIYLPGNHDYKIFDYHSIERFLIAPLRAGKKLSGRVSFFRSFPDSFLSGLISARNVKIRVAYPHVALNANGRHLVLTHGHFFDPSQAFQHEIGKVFRSARGLSAADIRKKRHAYFSRVSLYQNVMSGLAIRKELRRAFSSLYEPLTSVQQRLRPQSRRKVATPGMVDAMRYYLQFCCRRRNVAGLIFGHTHRAGQMKVEGDGLRIWNTGTFLRESSRSPRGTFITIRHDGSSDLDSAVRLHRIP
jgi:UDP-2,3-diacylglucosamine pyrophosphatase LpxH